MSLNRHKLAVGLLAALIHQAGWAQPGATASLLEQGRYWQAQGDAKRAAQAWEKLLLSDPSQQEALYGLGLAAVREKRLGDAQNYLGRLNRLEAGGRYAQRLQQDIALASGPGASDIDRARQLAAAGETDKAIQAYARPCRAASRRAIWHWNTTLCWVTPVPACRGRSRAWSVCRATTLAMAPCNWPWPST